MNIYEVVLLDSRGSRPDQNVITMRCVANSSQEAADKARERYNEPTIKITSLLKLIPCTDWE